MRKLGTLLLALFIAIPAFANGDSIPVIENGEWDTPYVIDSLEELVAFRDAVNAGESYYNEYFRLDVDINLESEEWTPIGTGYSKLGILSESEFERANTDFYTRDDFRYTSATVYEEGTCYFKLYAFSGVFDGNGHMISGLNSYITNGLSGFFGCVRDGMVSNLDVFSAKVYGETAGGVVGQLEYSGFISNCRFDGISTGKDAAGGIVGRTVGIPITGEPHCKLLNCINFGSVTSLNGAAGGIAGACSATNFSWCINKGAVRGDSAGGILGYFNAGRVTLCLAEGTVDGSTWAGGIAGDWYTGLVEDCKSLASISGERNIGGIVGGYSYINFDYEGTNSYRRSGLQQPSNSEIGRPFEPDPEQIARIEFLYGIPGFNKE